MGGCGCDLRANLLPAQRAADECAREPKNGGSGGRRGKWGGIVPPRPDKKPRGGSRGRHRRAGRRWPRSAGNGPGRYERDGGLLICVAQPTSFLMRHPPTLAAAGPAHRVWPGRALPPTPRVPRHPQQSWLLSVRGYAPGATLATPASRSRRPPAHRRPPQGGGRAVTKLRAPVGPQPSIPNYPARRLRLRAKGRRLTGANPPCAFCPRGPLGGGGQRLGAGRGVVRAPRGPRHGHSAEGPAPSRGLRGVKAEDSGGAPPATCSARKAGGHFGCTGAKVTQNACLAAVRARNLSRACVKCWCMEGYSVYSSDSEKKKMYQRQRPPTPPVFEAAAPLSRAWCPPRWHARSSSRVRGAHRLDTVTSGHPRVRVPEQAGAGGGGAQTGEEGVYRPAAAPKSR